MLHGFGFGLRILEPKPAETKPKPWFENQSISQSKASVVCAEGRRGKGRKRTTA
jgi:hypothetical protein